MATKGIDTFAAMENDILYELLVLQHDFSSVMDALEDVRLRLQLVNNSKCSIYSRSSKSWHDAQIIESQIESEMNEEWLTVRYGSKRKKIQRFNVSLKPITTASACGPITTDNYPQCHSELLSLIAKRLKSAKKNKEIQFLEDTQFVGTYHPREIALIYGYWLRTTLTETNISSSFLLDFVMKYLISFQWDSWRKHRGLTISADAMGVTHDRSRFSACTASLCSMNVLSADYMSFVKWEVMLRNRENSGTASLGTLSMKNSCAIWMGFIDNDYLNEKDTNFHTVDPIGSNEYAVALEIFEGFYPFVHCHGKFKEKLNKKLLALTVGDRFRLDFDLKAGECIAFYNDECIGTLCKELPQNICLAASVSYRGTSIETTMFDVKW